MMEDNGYFIGTVFRKQAMFNILAVLMSSIGPIVCAAITGTHFGSEGLAVFTICTPLVYVALFFGYKIAGGAQIVCAEYIAKDELDSVNKVYVAAVTIILILNVAVCSLLLLFQRPILSLLAGEVSAELSTYYTFFVFNAFLTMLIAIPVFFSKIVGRSEINLILMSVSTAVSVTASILLVRNMGVEGIAIGQAIGTFCGLVVAMYMMRKYFHYSFPKKLYFMEIITHGSPMGMSRLYILIATILLNSLFLRVGGSGALAVFGVISMLHRFITAVASGVSQTLTPLVSVFHVEQDATSIRQTMRCAFSHGNAIIFIIGLTLIILTKQIARAFGLNENVDMFYFAIPFYVLYSVALLNSTVFASYFNAIKRLILANVIAFLQELALLCTGAYILAAFLDIKGIWISFALSGILTLLILFIVVKVIKVKDKDLSFPFLFSQHLEKAGKYISFSVDSSHEKINEAATKIGHFCENNGLSHKQTIQVSMSIEEIITLIASKIEKRPFSVSVRLLMVDKKIILRIRFVGEKFDAIEYYKKNIADDVEKCMDIIGMKYIVQTAIKVYYRQTFGVNNLVVILGEE
jgi:Na+-driven multidrug efflux pump